MSIALTPSLVIKAGAVGVAGFVAFDVGRYLLGTAVNDGGVPKGTVTGIVMGHRHTAGAILSQLHHPGRVVALARAGQEALRAERERFSADSSMANNARDAFRHTYWGALMTTKLVDAGMTVDEAMQVAARVGEAHEDDSRLTGPAYGHSRSMDEHNNQLGASIGRRLVEQGHTGASIEDALQGATTAAIGNGEALVIDSPGSAPRASTTADLAILRAAASGS